MLIWFEQSVLHVCVFCCVGFFVYLRRIFCLLEQIFIVKVKPSSFFYWWGSTLFVYLFIISVMAQSIDTHFLTRSLYFMYCSWFQRIRSFVVEVLLKDYLKVSCLASYRLTPAVIIHAENRTLKIKQIQSYCQLIYFFILCFQLSAFLWWEQQSRYNEK